MAQRKAFAAVNWRIPTRLVTFSLRVVETKLVAAGVDLGTPTVVFVGVSVQSKDAFFQF